ncbi:hypothetical protein [Crateriforma conspicua]|uniref:hypothetical protein n=1 Tax=Crateriforma conspicua TaxID=2527996 RepID=UPI00118A1D76|nr:hypothetical protein [Crateriforma conspicua]QDV65154.1 hypothetical protein Mal65_43240 [Crateriforma conspicua]
MKKQILGFAVAALIVLGSAGSVSAAQLAAWDMYGVGTVSSVNPAASAAFVTADPMKLGPGLGTSGAGNALSSSGWGSTDTTDYISMGFTVDAGQAVDLDELIIGTRSSNTGPGTIGVFTNQDGFTSAVYSITQQGTDYANSIIDLSAFSGITGAFEVRLMEIGNTQADGSGNTSNGGTFRVTDYFDNGSFTDVQFTGDVAAVPAPTGLVALISLGLCGIVARRRRK